MLVFPLLATPLVVEGEEDTDYGYNSDILPALQQWVVESMVGVFYFPECWNWKELVIEMNALPYPWLEVLEFLIENLSNLDVQFSWEYGSVIAMGTLCPIFVRCSKGSKVIGFSSPRQ